MKAHAPRIAPRDRRDRAATADVIATPPADAAAASADSAARADVCTVDEVARWLGVNRKTVYDAVNRRQLPCARLGRRVLLSRAAITEWLAGRHS